jgi:hypothetical protein
MSNVEQNQNNEEILSEEEEDDFELLDPIEYGEAVVNLVETMLESPEEWPEPLPPDPYSFGMGERTFEQMGMEELAVIRHMLYTVLGINVMDPETLVRTYKSIAAESAEAPGEIEWDVLKTNRKGMVLQEGKYSDRMVRWVVGPDKNI